MSEKKNFFRTGNPTLRDTAFEDYGEPLSKGNTFTVLGASLKTLLLLAILSCTFGYTWIQATNGYNQEFSQPTVEGKIPDAIAIPQSVIGLAVAGCLGGFFVAMTVIFWQRSAPYLAPVYAALEGLALGAISAGFESQKPGIVLEAVGGTFGVTAGMLFLYATGICRPTEWLKTGVLAALLGICGLYTVDLLMQWCGGTYVPVVHSAGPWGLALQGLIVIVAAFCLILDFGQVSDAAEDKAPKWFEWYAGFSILVTLVWLYLEMLRLLAKLRGND